MIGMAASGSIGETGRCSVRCGLCCREDANAGRGERCRGRCAGLQAEPFEVSVQHQCRDGRIGSQADAGERPGRQHLRDLRGKAGACRGIGRWRAKHDVFGPVEDVHGALDARGCRIGQKKLAGSHLEVAMTVASGQADTGLGVRAAATALDLGFVPVTWEEFDIVLSAAALPAAEPLIATLRDPAIQSAVRSLGGYDLSQTGTVQLLA